MKKIILTVALISLSSFSNASLMSSISSTLNSATDTIKSSIGVSANNGQEGCYNNACHTNVLSINNGNISVGSKHNSENKYTPKSGEVYYFTGSDGKTYKATYK